MGKIINYGLVCRDEIVYFTQDVNELIANGYQPYGAPYSHEFADVLWHYQAMVKYAEEVKE